MKICTVPRKTELEKIVKKSHMEHWKLIKIKKKIFR